jgi:AcrR family transcriptional regulator
MATRDKTDQIRQQIIESTDDLLYHKGFNLMSFSDIAEAANVPRGNLYYHFKTKEDVLAAVIEYRITQMKAMLDDWDATIDEPLDRLKRYASIPLNELKNVVRYGCPMGSLNSELGKSQTELQMIARSQFDVFRRWIKAQFKVLCPDQDADNLSLNLLVRTQGLAVMSSVYRDKKLVLREVSDIEAWLDSLAS